jgi:hypothetical protein
VCAPAIEISSRERVHLKLSTIAQSVTANEEGAPLGNASLFDWRVYLACNKSRGPLCR